MYKIEKEYNSTKQPLVSELRYTLDGNFRAPFDLMRPHITIEKPALWYNFAVETCNYLEWVSPIAGTNRYYWIENYTIISDTLAELSCVEDVLATYKTGIGGSTQYVVRSSNTNDGTIIDTYYPIINTRYTTKHDLSGSIPWYMSTPALSSGWYVVGVINDDDNAYGAAAYYLFPSATFDNFRKKLLQNSTWTGMTFSDIEEPLYKSLFNPMQYITSVQWFPIPPVTPSASDKMLGITIGWGGWDITFGSNLFCYPLKNFIKTGSITLSTDDNIQVSSRGVWINFPPYRTRTLYIPPFGAVEIDTALLDYNTAPTLTYWIDFVTGSAQIRITNSTGYILAEAAAQMGVDVFIAGTSINPTKKAWVSSMATRGVQGWAEILTPNNGKIVSATAGLANANEAANSRLDSNGSGGSIMAFGIKPFDITVCKMVAGTDNSRFGKPLCSAVQISTISGFIMCREPHIDFSDVTLAERMEILRFMENGFIYE